MQVWLTEADKACSEIQKIYTAQKMKFSITDFSSKCDQILSFLRIWSHLLKKFLMENFIFCAVIYARLNRSSVIFLL